MGIKIDLDVYDKLALNMKMPKVVGKTTPLTKLPDDFEPESTEYENLGEEDIAGAIP